MSDNEPFTKIMRRETRKIHGISDALINAKLGIAMSDNRVWAAGLLRFYEVFKYLEEAMDRLKGAEISRLDVPGIRRKEAFEKDLTFYLGENWKSDYVPDPSVVEYLAHLADLEKHRPVLLLAYVYHLYMGLFAGGQILKKKRAIVLKLTFSGETSMEGLAVVDLGANAGKARKQIGEAMNALAEEFDADTKMMLIKESLNVFEMNNKMVLSIKEANPVVVKKLLSTAVIFAVLSLIGYFIFGTTKK